MGKRGNYRNISFEMEKEYYGLYTVFTLYKGIPFSFFTHRSDWYDYIDNDEHPEKKKTACAQVYVAIKNFYRQTYMRKR